MAVHGITSVRLNADGSPASLTWGLFDEPSQLGIVAPHPGDISEAIEAIVHGEHVFAVFEQSGKTIIGPRLGITTQGNEGTRLISAADGCPIAQLDLLTF